MNIKGIQVKKEPVVIEVTPNELVDRVIDLINSKHPAKGDHIGLNGRWQIFEWCHPHSGDEVYRQGDVATDEEKRIESIRAFLRDLAH